MGDQVSKDGSLTRQKNCIAAQMGNTFNWEEDMLKTGFAGSFRSLTHDAGYDPVVPMLSVDLKQRYSDRGLEYLGTQIGEKSYKARKKTTIVVLENLNLQKKEVMTVDLVSNQDFTEEECQWLRQSIK